MPCFLMSLVDQTQDLPWTTARTGFNFTEGPSKKPAVRRKQTISHGGLTNVSPKPFTIDLMPDKRAGS